MDKLKTPSIVALIGLGALIFFLRLHTYDEPLERDITTYAVIAHEMLGGKALYSDLWDHKPPAIHVTYAAAEVAAGYGRDSIFLLNVVAAVATMIACYFAGSASGGGRIGGLTAAALWALASGDLAMEGNQPNTELFINAFIAAGFAVFVRAEKDLGFRQALAAGAFFAVASLYKPVVVAAVGLICLAYLACARGGNRTKSIVNLATIAATGVAAWAAVFGYFAWRGRGAAFREVVFTYNHWYSGSMWHNLGAIFSWPPVPPDVLAVTLSVALLPVVGLILASIFGARRPWILLGAFAIGTHLAVLLPGRFFPHYYQLWLPPLVIGAGWTIGLLKRVLPERLSPFAVGVAGATCAILVALESPYYQMPARDWSAQKYGSIFIESEELSRRIDNLLPPGASFYEWGNESGLYFTSGRAPPSGLIFAYPTLAGPLAVQLSQRLMEDLQRSRPELAVVDLRTLAQTPPAHPVLKWLKENYRPFSRSESFLLLARNGSNLADRLAIAAK